MLQGEHSAILLTFIKLPFVIKIFVFSIFEWSFYTGFTVELSLDGPLYILSITGNDLQNILLYLKIVLILAILQCRP